MPRRDPRIALQQMRDHAHEAIDLMQGRRRADLESVRMLNLSLVRLLEIVGEAANRVPTDERERYPAIPWPGIVGLRNRLIHGYDEVDLDVVWQVVTADLPLLVAELDRILPP